MRPPGQCVLRLSVMKRVIEGDGLTVSPGHDWQLRWHVPPPVTRHFPTLDFAKLHPVDS